MPIIKKKRTREHLLIWFFLAPSLAIFMLYRIIPLIWNAVLSFQFWSPYKASEFAGLYHYEEMLFYDDAFRQSLWNTIIFMASSPIGIALALGLLTAGFYGIASKLKSKKTIKSLDGKFELETPRDRDGTFSPKIVKKHQTTLSNEIEQKIRKLLNIK